MVSAQASDLWQHAKPLLLPYEGMASQLYVLSLPLEKLESVVRIFLGSVTESSVVVLDYFAADQGPIEELVVDLLSRSSKTTMHELKGVHSGRENLCLYVWIDAEAQTFDAELVFWADQLFPDPDNEPECLRVFERYVELAESIRAQSPTSECVISASETGDPREERDKPWTLWW